MSDNNKGAHTKPRLDPGLWDEAIYAKNKAQEKIIYDLDLDWEDEMECDYRVPTSNEVISQIENKWKSSLTKDQKKMIETMYLGGIDDGLTFGEFCDKYYGYN